MTTDDRRPPPGPSTSRLLRRLPNWSRGQPKGPAGDHQPQLTQEHFQSSVANRRSAHAGWGDFRAGFVATMPLWLGVAPFGAIYAVTARAAGLSAAQTLAMSLLVFAGASQFTAAGLFAIGAPPLTIVITTLIINARHALLAASLAPFVRRTRPALKALLAFQLTDESYAVGMRSFLDGRGSLAYQFGSNLSLYTIWQCSTIAGMLLSEQIPDPAAYGLDLVFPLTFIGLLVPLLRDRVGPSRNTPLLVAALAGALAIGGALALPGRWYILIAGIAASGVGAVLNYKGKETRD